MQPYQPPLALRRCGQQGLELSEQGLGCKSLSPGTESYPTPHAAIIPTRLWQGHAFLCCLLCRLCAILTITAQKIFCQHGLDTDGGCMQATMRRRRRLPPQTRPPGSSSGRCRSASASSTPRTSTGRSRTSAASVCPWRLGHAQRVILRIPISEPSAR